MGTWHSTWLKSRTRLLTGASEYMENGTTAKSGNWDSDMELGLSEIRHDVGRDAAKYQANGCSSLANAEIPDLLG